MEKLVSIILRTKNEEFWVGRLVEALKDQKGPYSFEIVVVDNNSSDETIAKIGALFKQVTIVKINESIPGVALNRGVEASNGDYIVCISAHCIPADHNWIKELLAPLEDPEVAATYGRQIPLMTSKSSDKRDLWLTFGLDDKIQIKDPFIHNANAAYRRADLLKYPFDEKMTNIEDRGWASLQLKANRKIYYTSKAVVYHDHGIHQTCCVERLDGVIGMMDDLHKSAGHIEDYYGLKAKVAEPTLCLIIPISNRYGKDDLEALRKQAKAIKSRFAAWTIFIMPSQEEQASVVRELDFDVLDFRIEMKDRINRPLLMDISKAVEFLTEKGLFFDYVGTYDVRRWTPTTNFLQRAMNLIQSEKADSAIGSILKPKPTFTSIAGDSYQMEYKGWLNWLDGIEITKIPVLDPSLFILSKMHILRSGNPLQSKFCPVELID